ncbi:MAG: response regulator transcription factor [Bacteroidales bacterium]|nr:response regulator transcription factor [Bacteroidales bacterium]
MTDNITRILLTDDHNLLVDGLKRSLNEADGLKVVGTANSIKECMEFLSGHPVDLLLLDVQLPDGNSIDFVPKILQAHSSLKIVILSSFAEPTVIRRAIDAGISGYLLKNSNSDEITKGVLAVADGEHYISPEANALLKEAPKHVPSLTRREREVLHLVVEGLSTKEIAARLDLSFDTIHDYLRNLRIKLDAKSMADLVCRAKDQCL